MDESLSETEQGFNPSGSSASPPHRADPVSTRRGLQPPRPHQGIAGPAPPDDDEHGEALDTRCGATPARRAFGHPAR